MSGHWRPAAVAAAALLGLACAGSGFAATPQQIYKDVIENGRLDGSYTLAELNRAFPVKKNVKTEPAPRRPIRVAAASEAAETPPTRVRHDRRIPFSGIDAALLAAGAAPLFLVAAGLRRRASAPRKAQALSG